MGRVHPHWKLAQVEQSGRDGDMEVELFVVAINHSAHEPVCADQVQQTSCRPEIFHAGEVLASRTEHGHRIDHRDCVLVPFDRAQPKISEHDIAHCSPPRRIHNK